MSSSLLSNVSFLQNADTSKISEILKIDPELQKYQKCMSMQVTLKQDEKKNKYSVASLNLPLGSCVHEETAAACILKTDYLKYFCHHCLGNFERRDDNPLSMPKLFISDDETNKAIYCSNKCKEQAKPAYSIISPIMDKVSKIAKDNEIEDNLLKLIVTILAQNVVNNNNNEIINLISEFPSYEEKEIEELVNWYKRIKRSIDELFKILPEKLQNGMTAEKLYDIACKLSYYALSPCDGGHANPDVGLGVYPYATLFFRHSCQPNCCLTYRNTNVEIFTIQPVKVGEELTISYVDLYQARYERGQEIYMKRHEWCTCSRCTESIDKSVDRYLCGLLCDGCKKEVYSVESNGHIEYNSKVKGMEEKNNKRREKIRELVRLEFKKMAIENKKAEEKEKEAENKEENSTTPSTTETTETEAKKETSEKEPEVVDPASNLKKAAENAGKEEEKEVETLKIVGVEENEVYTCPSCGHQRNKAETLSFLQRAAGQFNIPTTFVQSGQYGTAEGFLQTILERYSKFLHPDSYYLMNAKVQLLNCYICQQKWDDCISLAKQIIEQKEKSNVYPSKYYPELVDLYEGLGDYCSESLEAKKSDLLGLNSSSSNIRKKYLTKERSKSYQTCYDLRKAVYGEGHPKTLAIKRKIDAIEKN